MTGTRNVTIPAALQDPVGRRPRSTQSSAIREPDGAQVDVVRHRAPSESAPYDDIERSLHATYLAESGGNGAMFGAFVDGRLDACLSVFLWRAFPYFSIGNLKTRPGHVNLFATGANPVAACADAALTFTASQGTFRGYMVRALQRWPADRVRRSLARVAARVDHYHYEVELVVPRNTRPRYGFVWSLMGERTWPQDLAVEAMTLKQERRSISQLPAAA